MGMFDNLMTKIFRHAAPAERPADARTTGIPASAGARPAAVATQVDVDAILTRLASENTEKLDWKHSIVDLMKLVDMDSSLNARKELAEDLGYKGNMGDSATMNVWLHKEVMKKLADNGGKLPADLDAR